MAETNGMANIRVGGENYPLLFGRLAVQEMTTRSLANPSANPVLLTTNLIYSGILNYAVFSDSAQPVYTEIYLLVEQFANEEDASEQEKLLWEIFEASRWGSDWVNELKEAKKKVEKVAKQVMLKRRTGES